MTNLLKNIRIVLVSPSHPGNIGSAARAMKTMGFKQLVLVAPKLFPNPKATELAAGADDILSQAIVVDSLIEALEGCSLAIATSARPRELALKLMDPKACAQLILSEKASTNVALVFGREHAGLTNEELLTCHYHVMIPADPIYSSLNLAAAVQIICYELRMASLGNEKFFVSQKDRFATVQELQYFYLHLENVLTKKGFLKSDPPKRIMPRLKRLFGRLRLENREVRLLRGILTMVEKE